MFVITKTQNGGYGHELYSYPIGVVEESDSKCISALDQLVSDDMSGKYANIPSSCGYAPVWSQAWYNLFDITTAPHLGGSLMAMVAILYVDERGDKWFIQYDLTRVPTLG